MVMPELHVGRRTELLTVTLLNRHHPLLGIS
jgi:hypothetical protein